MAAMFAKEDNGTSPVETHHTPGPQGTTVIGASVVIEGELTSKEAVVINGKVKGTVRTSEDLTVGKSSTIEADVFATNAKIAGTITGNLTVDQNLTLASTAKVEGDIQTTVISIETGAVINGRISTTQAGSTAPTSVPASKPAEQK